MAGLASCLSSSFPSADRHRIPLGGANVWPTPSVHLICGDFDEHIEARPDADEECRHRV
jgi:hypothetical protein